jgi:hypothetical protein
LAQHPAGWKQSARVAPRDQAHITEKTMEE